MKKTAFFLASILTGLSLISSCNNNAGNLKETTENVTKPAESDTPVYFNLRPKLEK
jgi:hypothetical protein